MAYALVQTRNRPDMALPAANKALHIITESSGGLRTMDLACARAVVAASMHASGDCTGAIKEYGSVGGSLIRVLYSVGPTPPCQAT
jgi:hypothetical protein